MFKESVKEASSLTAFEWHRPSAPPVWMEGEIIPDLIRSSVADAREIEVLGAQRRFLVRFPEVGRGTPYRPIDEHPELWRKFADLDGHEESFRDFAAEYGMLGVGLWAEGAFEYGEPFEYWQRLWIDLRLISRLLSLATEAERSPKARRELMTAIQVNSSDKAKWIEVVGFGPPDRSGRPKILARIFHSRDSSLGGSLALTVRPEVFDFIDRERSSRQPIVIARLYVQYLVNYWMKGVAIDGVNVSVQVHAIDRNGVLGHRVQLVPSNLAGALCVLAARELEGDIQHRQCRHCNKWFTVSISLPTGKRAHAQYCHVNCRVNAHNAKKRKERKTNKRKGKP